MKVFVNKDIRHFFRTISVVMTAFLVIGESWFWLVYGEFSEILMLFLLALAGSVLAACFWYFRRQNRMMENAVAQINDYLAGNFPIN